MTSGSPFGRHLTREEAEAQGYIVTHVREHGGVHSMLTPDRSYTVVFGAPSYMSAVLRADSRAKQKGVLLGVEPPQSPSH